MTPLRLAKLPAPVKQVAASSLATVVLLENGELWLRGRFQYDAEWEQIPPLEDENFQPISVAQIALCDHPTLDFPEYDILAVTTDGHLFEYATKRSSYTKEWRAV